MVEGEGNKIAIYRANSNRNFQLLKKAVKNENSFIDSRIEKGLMTYYYKLVIIDSNNKEVSSSNTIPVRL